MVELRRALLGAAALALSACCHCRSSESVAPAARAVSSASARYTSGVFGVREEGGHSWLIAPDGARFVSQGVNAVGDGSFRAPNQNYYDPVSKQFNGNHAAWVKSALERLSRWGFNTVGAWSDYALYEQQYPYTFILYAAGNEHPLDHVFEPGFEQLVAQHTEPARARKGDPYLIGYFLDNELPWWGEFGWRAAGQKSLLQRYALAAAGGAGKAALRGFLERRYQKDVARFNRVYGTAISSFDALTQPLVLTPQGHAARRDADEFAGVVAERFFSVTTLALRERDPNHLQLCVRFAGAAPWPVVRVAAKYCDVISVNQYQQSGNIDRRLLDDFYAATHKPLLITEYSFSATENQSGDPNTRGAMVTVPTQRARAEHTTRFVEQALRLPYVVGMHWFEWADESPQGRFDGEDQNYGLVDIHDGAYAFETEAHAHLNAAAVETHARSKEPFPGAFQGDREPTLRAASPLSAPRSFYEAGQAGDVPTWGDAAQGGSAKIERRSDAMLLQFTTGSGWGAGASLLPTPAPFDASGAEHLELRLQIPAQKTLQVLLNEAGAAAPGQASYVGQRGSDGESYEFSALAGTGKVETYVIDLRELDRRSSWGNQTGNLQLDLQALATVDLYLPGKQDSAEVRVLSVRFTP